MTSRGQLRVYLGAAPGVGKTYKMLEEGHRRQRPRHRRRRRLRRDATAAATPRRCSAGWRWCPAERSPTAATTFTEMDVDAVLARRPRGRRSSTSWPTPTCPARRNAKRWQDIEELLDAGITVITTVNIQHLESLNDVVAADHRRAAARDRARRGRPPGRADRAGRHDPGGAAPADGPRQHLQAREGRRRARQLLPGRQPHRAARAGPALAGRQGRRAARPLPRRAPHLDDLGDPRAGRRRAHRRPGGRHADPPGRPHRRPHQGRRPAGRARRPQRRPGRRRPGPPGPPADRWSRASAAPTTRSSAATSPTALLDFARGVNATQLVLGASRRGRLAQIFSPGVGVTTTAESGPIDVHLVTHEAGQPRPRRTHRLTRGADRRAGGSPASSLAALGLPLLTLALDPAARRSCRCPATSCSSSALVVAVALVGGLYPALAAAVAGFLLLNYYFTPPIHQFTIAERENVLALRRLPARRGRGQRRGRPRRPAHPRGRPRPRRGGDAVHPGRQRAARQPPAARAARPAPRDVRAHRRHPAGTPARRPRSPDAAARPGRLAGRRRRRRPALPRPRPRATPTSRSTTTSSLVLRGHPLAAADRRVVEAFAAQAAVALRQERLAEQAAAARPLAEADRLRTALLSAVSHDLRTPLASAKAAVGSLRSHDVAFSDDDRDELLATAEESLDRLIRLVENLLDMSRLQAGALGMSPAADQRRRGDPPRRRRPRRPAGRDVAHRTSPTSSPRSTPTRPCWNAILVNLLANALRYSPPDQPPLDHRQRTRRPGRGPRHRPRPGHPRRRPGPGLPAVPTPRRPRQRHRRRPRPRPVPRPGRGHGRHPRPRSTPPAAGSP